MQAAIPLAIGSGALSAVSSASAARQQNRAIRRSVQSANRSAEIQADQAREQARVEKQRRIREAQQMRGRVRVAAGEAGFSMGGSFEALQRQADFDLNRNLGIIQNNLANNIQAINTGNEARRAQLSANIRNPMLDAFSSALGGASAGLNIASGFNEVSKFNQAQAAQGGAA